LTKVEHGMDGQSGASGQNSKGPDLKALYEEVCKQHDGIAEFRAKLLSLLPLASGAAGIFLLVSDKLNAASMPYLVAIGAFGLLSTFGLFWYELRGIQKCHILIECGTALEARLFGQQKCLGAFSTRQEGVPFPLRNWKPFTTVGAVGAALIIYPTVLGGWAYVTSVGILSLLISISGLNPPLTAAMALLPSAGVTIWCMWWGRKVRQQQKNQAEEELKEIQDESRQWLQTQRR
jgi:hypothetical protein